MMGRHPTHLVSEQYLVLFCRWVIVFDRCHRLQLDLLNFLDENNLKTTFFVVGSRVISYPATLIAEYQGLHQVRSS